MSDRFAHLVELIARLRDPADGCPWDLAQDHRTLRPYVVEEAHEVVAAIDGGHPEALANELGDLLLQVLLHSRIAEEAGEFSLDDVLDGLADKLTRRHPHVFGAASNDLSAVRARWETIKASEPQHPAELPVLVAARKWVANLPDGTNVEALFDPRDGDERAGLELLANIARLWGDGVDPEIALRKALRAAQSAAGGLHAQPS